MEKSYAVLGAAYHTNHETVNPSHESLEKLYSGT